MIETLAEGHTIAAKRCLGKHNLHQFIQVMFPGTCTAYSGRMMSREYYHKREEPLFAVDLLRKDARHATGVAEANGMMNGDVEVADEHLSDVQSYMQQRGDIAGIYGAVRKKWVELQKLDRLARCFVDIHYKFPQSCLPCYVCTIISERHD